MEFLKKLLGRSTPEKKTTAPVVAVRDHSVRVCLRLSKQEFGSSEERAAIGELTSILQQRIKLASAGEFDSAEYEVDECTLFMSGANAGRLFAAFEKQLRMSPLARGGYVLKRYGSYRDPLVREERVEL